MRRVVALVSVKGAPGVTTTALALAAAWPAGADGGVRPVVVEADAAGGDVAARLGRSHVPGLLEVAAAAGRPFAGSVLGAAQELPWGVRAVLAPVGAGQCRAAVRVLEEEGGRMLRGERRDVGTVLLDLGRVEQPAEGLAGVAESVAVVTRGGVDALAHVCACRQALAGRPVVLAVVGPCPYRPAEVAQVVGIDQVVVLPWAPKSAAVFSAGCTARLRTSGWRRSALLAGAGRLAERLLASTRSPEHAAAVPVVRGEGEAAVGSWVGAR